MAGSIDEEMEKLFFVPNYSISSLQFFTATLVSHRREKKTTADFNMSQSEHGYQRRDRQLQPKSNGSRRACKRFCSQVSPN